MRSSTGSTTSLRVARSGAVIASALALALAACTSGGDGGTSAVDPTSPPTASDSTPLAGDISSPLKLVAIGDSIPFNSPNDCPGCTGFVDQYAAALEEATGRPVETTNLSQHNGLTLPMLLDELDDFRDQLSAADAIIVGVAHNTIALNSDDPCGTTFDSATNTFVDWSALDQACSEAASAAARPLYDELFSTIAGWRQGQATILRTIDKYSDWLGWPAAHLTPEQEQTTVMFHDDWNRMLCDAATANEFVCVDIYHSFNGPDGTTPSGPLLAADYTHPSQLGNDLIAQQLVEAGFAPLA